MGNSYCMVDGRDMELSLIRGRDDPLCLTTPSQCVVVCVS